MDLTNFNRYDYINNLIDKILVLYKIKTLDGIDDCCNVNSFIFIDNSQKKISDQSELRKYINYKYY